MRLVNGMSGSIERPFGSIGMDDVAMELKLWNIGFHLSLNQFFMYLILIPLETLMKKSYGWCATTRTFMYQALRSLSFESWHMKRLIIVQCVNFMIYIWSACPSSIKSCLLESPISEFDLLDSLWTYKN